MIVKKQNTLLYSF